MSVLFRPSQNHERRHQAQVGVRLSHQSGPVDLADVLLVERVVYNRHLRQSADYKHDICASLAAVKQNCS